ncbi:MAG: glycosyltransferase family 2 protein [Chlamydiia bacterium]|nr:glycosyltransferase family 2 protein [Chlamydiia bacterium]
MRKGFVFLFLIAALASTYYGLKNHFGIIEKISPQSSSSSPQTQKKLSTVCPVLEDQMIVAVVLAEYSAQEVERNLDSLFSQTYPHMRVVLVDNGSTDGTFERVETYAKNREKHIELIRYEKKKPQLEVLYHAIGKCDPHEIVAVIEGKDWLSHENVFDHLNCAYANPEVWMTHSRSISHPNYQEVSGKAFSDPLLMGKGMRQQVREEVSPLVTFYAGFFQEIKLQDFLYQGEFIDECYRLAMFLPLIEMGPGHLLFIDEVSYVKNESHQTVDHKLHLQKVAAVESYLRSLPTYPTLSQLKGALKSPSFHRYKADVVLFSEDSPLHLYACLESLFANGRDINEVYVLYKGGDHEFQRAYLNLQNEFHTVHFLNVCDYPGNDYSSLITKVLSNKRHASPFVVIGGDHMLFEEKIRFHECIVSMEMVHADHFLLSPQVEEGESLTSAISIDQGIYAYQLGEKGTSQPFTMAICRKTLFDTLEGIDDLPAFRKLWQRKLLPAAVALFFEEKKVLPLKTTQEPTLAQRKEWGHRFIEGFKIDLSSLSCELDEMEKGELPLIKRDRRRTAHQPTE